MWTLGIENNFYKSQEWKKLLEVLKMERVNQQDGHLYCEHCGKPILKKYDAIAHHVIELTEDNVNDTSISLNSDNIMFVHHHCHNEIHNRFSYHRKQVFVVFGSPFSGKMDYVKEAASQNDIICDIDNIYECISINKRFCKPQTIKSCVFDIKDFIIEMIRLRKGKWSNAYIVSALPSRQQRERLVNLVNAREIFIDTNKEECINRCIEYFGSKERAAEYLNYIEEWFEDYSE